MELPKPLLITIRFCDNDFGNTFRAIGEMIADGLPTRKPLTVDLIKLIISHSVKGQYILHQNLDRYKYDDDETFEDHLDHIHKYIMDKFDKHDLIKFDDEAKEAITNEMICTNGEMLIIEYTPDYQMTGRSTTRSYTI